MQNIKFQKAVITQLDFDFYLIELFDASGALVYKYNADQLDAAEFADTYKNVTQAPAQVFEPLPDLFETPEALPIEVQTILEKYSKAENNYENCAALLAELAPLGYVFKYGLDAEPFGLRQKLL